MKKILASIVIGILALTLVSGKAMNALLMFLLFGALPGTHFTIPYWVMMAAYCLIITLIVSDYLETALLYIHRQKAAHAPKPRMPRRRYGSL